MKMAWDDGRERREGASHGGIEDARSHIRAHRAHARLLCRGRGSGSIRRRELKRGQVTFGKWTLLCGRVGKDGTGEERCSLVLALVEPKSQKLVFRVVVTYGPKGHLVLRVDGPTGVALQRGVEFSPDTKKIYRLAYQTCLPMGCKALLLVSDDLKKALKTSKQGTITVFALNGKAVQTVAGLSGFAEGLAALDKRRAGSAVEKPSRARHQRNG